ELGWSPWHRTGLEGLQAALAILGQPPIDRRSGHSQRRGDLLRMHAVLDLPDGADAQLLQGLVVELAAVVVAHAATRSNHHHNVKLLMNALVSPKQQIAGSSPARAPGPAGQVADARRDQPY